MRKFCASLFFNFPQRKKCFLFTIEIKKTKQKKLDCVYLRPFLIRKEREREKKRLNKMRKHFIDRFLI